MAAIAPADGREVVGAASLQDKFKLGWQGLKSSIEKTASAEVCPELPCEARSSSQRKESKEVHKDTAGVDQQVANLFSWAEKARKAVAEKVAYDAVPNPGGDSGTEEADVEKGAEQKEKSIGAMWAKAASSVKKQVAKTTEEANKGLQKGVLSAKSLEWGEPAAMVSKGMSSLAEKTTTAGSALQEKGKAASVKASALKEKSAEKLSEAKSNAGDAAKKAKDKAASAAGAAGSKLKEAGSSVTGAVGGAASLAMNPVKLAQFIGIFFVGAMLITLSFSFLPVLVIAPQKFALLFAFGSLVIMGSLAFLKGPKALATQLAARDKLPFSAAYIVGLVGTLAATLILRSFILTALFGVLQAVALMYFLASYVPGGQALLNFCGRCTGRCTVAACKSCPGRGVVGV